MEGDNYVYPDHLGTPRVITDTTNQARWRWDNSDPFGANAPNEDPDGDGVGFVYNLRFPGQYFDQETGLHYNYFRDYDPGVGRYVESDPIGLKGGLNTYSYVGGNPISYTDPMGLKKLPNPFPREIIEQGKGGELGIECGGAMCKLGFAAGDQKILEFCTEKVASIPMSPDPLSRGIVGTYSGGWIDECMSICKKYVSSSIFRKDCLPGKRACYE